MMQRILTGWSFRRAMFLAFGAFIIVQSIIDKQWIGILAGSYFASMGLFAFGCAGGSCVGGACEYKEEAGKVPK